MESVFCYPPSSTFILEQPTSRMLAFNNYFIGSKSFYFIEIVILPVLNLLTYVFKASFSFSYNIEM